MSQEKKNLDNLCHLLDRIILEHNCKETPASEIKCPLAQKVYTNQIREPPTSQVHTKAEPSVKEEKSRDEVEQERKARKEAKKARKKGGETGKLEEKKEGVARDKNTGAKDVKPQLGAALDQEKKTGNKKKPQQQQQTSEKLPKTQEKPEQKAQQTQGKPKQKVQENLQQKPQQKSQQTQQKPQQTQPSPQQAQQKPQQNQQETQQKPQQAQQNQQKAQQKPQQAQQNQQQAQQKPQGGTSEDAISGKSKAELRKERREKQEAQRRAKQEAKVKQEEGKKENKKPEAQANNKSNKAEKSIKSAGERVRVGREKKLSEKKTAKRRIPLLGHLTPPASRAPECPLNSDVIHPAVRTLGIKMKDHVIDGSTARMVSTLAALKSLINDYRTPESCDLSRDLAEKLAPNIAFLNACRPQAVAMDNAIRFLKHKINSIDPSTPEGQAKDTLRTAIDDYVKENISLASSTIASHAASLMQLNDIILTFGYSALVCEVVEAACKAGHNVGVVVVDSPYPPSGVAMVQRLADMGVPTYYRLVTDITSIIDKVTKVVVEAEAVMMNGAIQGLCGTTSLALAAATYHKPFIVLCHTYKFCNNDLTDSLVVNELGDADRLVWGPSGAFSGLLAGWQDTDKLNVISLVYDVTPASLVTALVTEQSVLPTSAVPVIIRRNYADVLGQD